MHLGSVAPEFLAALEHVLVHVHFVLAFEALVVCGRRHVRLGLRALAIFLAAAIAVFGNQLVYPGGMGVWRVSFRKDFRYARQGVCPKRCPLYVGWPMI